jgi:hypothetical protein
MTAKQLSDLDRIKQGHLVIKGSIRADEKISVAYPSPLAPSKALLAEFMHFASDYLQVAGPNPSEEVKKNARLYAWDLTNYEERYRQEIAGRPEAQAELYRILARLGEDTPSYFIAARRIGLATDLCYWTFLEQWPKSRKGKPTCYGWHHRRPDRLATLFRLFFARVAAEQQAWEPE